MLASVRNGCLSQGAMLEDQPLPPVVASLRRHLLEEHDFPDFELERDLYWEQNPAGSPRAIYLVEVDDRPPGFKCQECGQRIFSEPSYGDPRRNQALRRRYSAALAPLLRGLLNEEQEKVISDWDRGRFAHRNLERIERKDAQRVRRTSDPEIMRRIVACQAFLLEHYREHANKEQAIEALCALAKTDPERHYEIFRRNHPYSRETYAGYWKQIPIAERQAAKAEGLKLIAARKVERRAGLERKLTP
jgi:hypothetical protein